jgi:hypothetical protein
VPRVRKELKRLNDEIRKNIRSLSKSADKAKLFASRQVPKNFKVAVSGITISGARKKKHRKHNRASKKTKKSKKK